MAKSIADKVDVGAIISQVAKEDLMSLDAVIKMKGCPPPTMVVDIYKVRRGRYKGVRIWSIMDLGTARQIDLFATNLNYEPIPIDIVRVMFEEAPFIPMEEAENKITAPTLAEGERLDVDTGEITKTPVMGRKKRFEDLI